MQLLLDKVEGHRISSELHRAVWENVGITYIVVHWPDCWHFEQICSLSTLLHLHTDLCRQLCPHKGQPRLLALEVKAAANLTYETCQIHCPSSHHVPRRRETFKRPHVTCTSVMSLMPFFLCLQTLFMSLRVFLRLPFYMVTFFSFLCLWFSVSLSMPVMWFLCFFVTFITISFCHWMLSSESLSFTGAFAMATLEVCPLPCQQPCLPASRYSERKGSHVFISDFVSFVVLQVVFT